MSGYSKVGTSGVYEAGDQRNYKASEAPRPTRYEEGVENSHLPNDSSMFYLHRINHIVWPVLTRITEDERSIANRLANEEVRCVISAADAE